MEGKKSTATELSCMLLFVQIYATSNFEYSILWCCDVHFHVGNGNVERASLSLEIFCLFVGEALLEYEI